MSRNFELMQQQARPILHPASVSSKAHPDTHQIETRLDLGPVPREEKIGVVRRILSLFERERKSDTGKARDDHKKSSLSSALEEDGRLPSSETASAKLRLASTSDGRKLTVYSLVRRP